MMSLHEVEEQLNFWGWPHHPWEVTLGNTHLAFNPKTMIMTWITMILVALFCVAATRKMSLNRPKGAQNILEIFLISQAGPCPACSRSCSRKNPIWSWCTVTLQLPLLPPLPPFICK
jgi:hypothetical protein